MILRDMVIGVLFMSMIAIGMSSVFVDLSSNYSVPLDENNLSSFKNLNSTLSMLKAMDNQTTSSVLQNIPIMSFFASLTLGGINLIRFVFSIPSLFINMIGDVTAIIGLPPQFSLFIEAVLITIILFTVISVLVKWKV